MVELTSLKYFDDLNTSYSDFYARVANEPFYVNGPVEDNSNSITSFLCTDPALDIYNAAKAGFESLKLEFPDYKPKGSDVKNALSNDKALASAKGFYLYASTLGKRGTPHKL